MKKTGLADSPFFLKPSQPQTVRGDQLQPPAQSERFSERNSERSNATPPPTLPPPIPGRRETTRYSFEFFQDQIVAIKRLKYQAEMEGRRVSLSDIARQAIDDYLKQHAA